MSEIERLREVLRCIADLPMDRCSTENDYRLSAAKAIALGALSQQAEPVCDWCAGAGHDFYGDKCIYCKSEPSPAQDEREFNTSDSDLTELLNIAADMLKGVGGGMDLGIYFAAVLERVERRLADLPAQTEQQPVGWQSIVLHASELADMVLKGDAPQTAQRTARALLSMLAAPIAQAEPAPAQFCDDVAHDDWRRDGFPCPACTKKPATAQDERDLSIAACAAITHRMVDAFKVTFHQHQRMAVTYDESVRIGLAAALSARPAQTEQQPVVPGFRDERGM